ncbi:hypothetical protein AB0M23_25685 [Streptomyces sp. NPDC052077]|uniref:hypothetical protein n=1 Tax=Streptomyces sp. NPDC052077 TaxID=3154757 RepID=UPI0034284B62
MDLPEGGENSQGEVSEDYSAPLARWAQVGAGIVGTLLTGGGGVAVFVSDNQAGTVALVLAGAIFLLMTFGGAPLHSLGFGEANLRFARRRQEVVRGAIDSSPEQAPRVLRDLESVDSQSRPDPTVGALTERIYEDAIFHFLRNAFPQYVTNREKTVGLGRRVDFAVDLPSGKPIVVEARYFRRGNPVDPGAIDLAAGYHTITRSPVLLVSNSPLSRMGADYLRALQESGADIHFAQWFPDGDDEPLKSAVAHLAQQAG